MLIALLFLTALAAGFIDAIAGGGGLLTIPALLLTGLPPHLVLGTNKGQAVFGSGTALVRYAHSPLLDRQRAVRSFGPGLAGAALGAGAVGLLAPGILRPLVMALLGAVAVFMLFYRPPHVSPAPRCRPVAALAIAVGVAAYDGFFGPGTGTFLILAYVLVLHDSLDAASANAKVVNFASNLAALAMFSAQGAVVWRYAVPMGAGQALGALAGAHLTIKTGRGLVRYTTLLISLALLGKLTWDLVH